ncbi:hypothetical protein AM233_04095 [Bacillus sp. FJAT-22058]|nr:hypothetical protein AM233_04095 [Bacillus sp. FJAT-22058]
MVAPQRGRSWTGLGVFLEDSKQELEITLLAKRLGTSGTHIRINVKKFIQVLYFETKRSIRNHYLYKHAKEQVLLYTVLSHICMRKKRWVRLHFRIF